MNLEGKFSKVQNVDEGKQNDGATFWTKGPTGRGAGELPAVWMLFQTLGPTRLDVENQIYYYFISFVFLSVSLGHLQVGTGTAGMH